MISSKDYNHVSRKINLRKNIVLIDKVRANTPSPGPMDYVWHDIRHLYSFQPDDTQVLIMFAFKNSRNNIW